MVLFSTVFRYHTDVQQTCANNRHQCSVHAICTDYPNGFCCSCIAGYKGNGRQCVAEGKFFENYIHKQQVYMVFLNKAACFQ